MSFNPVHTKLLGVRSGILTATVKPYIKDGNCEGRRNLTPEYLSEERWYRNFYQVLNFKQITFRYYAAPGRGIY